MDPRLLKHYETELRHVRELGGEFARDFPKIAGRLGLDSFECADPYVERLLEGFAFLAARVQLKMDSEFPQLVQNLLEIVYPHFLAPMPSMAVVQFTPDLGEAHFRKATISHAARFSAPNLSKANRPHANTEQRTMYNSGRWKLPRPNISVATSPPSSCPRAFAIPWLGCESA